MGAVMIEGIYHGAASLAALERWQAVISQNLASSSATGFKKEDLSFEGLASSKAAANQDGGFSATSMSMMPRVHSAINFETGDVRETGNETDFAVRGPGFFQVRKSGGEEAYTRDGGFHINGDNTLVTKQGYEVQGEDGPITVNPEDGRLTLGTDGTISQGDNVIGKLSLRDFSDPSLLQRLDGGLFAPTKGAAPTIVENPSITQGAIEASNVSPLAEMVNLVSVSRAYEASQKMITSHDEMLRQAIQTLGGAQQA
jgi:flagellar basal-body rod protein FlgF